MNRPPKKRGPRQRPFPPGYVALIVETGRHLRAWLADHPAALPLIQFNYPQDMQVIAALPQAVLAHYITVNEDAGRMIEEIDRATHQELTLMQFRYAWEELTDNEKFAP